LERLAAISKPLEPDRFLAFAFAAADLLAEVDHNGRVRFAAGAFERRLGRSAESLVGEPAERIVRAADRPVFAHALALLLVRGRLLPTKLRLDGPGEPAMALSGLAVELPDGTTRVSLCFSALPAETPESTYVPGAPDFAAAAEERLREGSGVVDLLEFLENDGPIQPRPALVARIGETLSENALSAELAPGRFGMLRGDDGLVEVVSALEEMLRDAGHEARAAPTTIALSGTGLTGMQATRALRYALSAFAQGGEKALSEAGFRGGLAGFVRQATARAAWISAILTGRRFRLAFQPIVSLADSVAHHYEALIRPLGSMDGRPQSAQDFVTFAETVGLSEELDWAVALTAAEAAERAGGPRIALNLSALSLQAPAFRERLLSLIAEKPHLAQRLLVEVTETAEIEDEAEAVRTAEALRAQGLPICIDDFGAGTAAFRMLRVLPVDYVKVDGHYVTRAVESARERGFVSAMVDLAAAVGAKVIAERIETEAQAALMRELGVGYGQGFLFGRPGALPG
jgi:EAL domain-containing protein (putative c-di-GMP-specific phosphodiesterase class I)